MASTDSDAEDAITKDEITGAASAPPVTETGISHGTKRNACKSCLVLSCLAFLSTYYLSVSPHSSI